MQERALGVGQVGAQKDWGRSEGRGRRAGLGRRTGLDGLARR